MQPHRLVGQGLHHSQLHHPVRQQPQFPVVVALEGWAAGQGDQSLPRTRYGVGLGPFVQLPVPTGLDSVLKRPLQPISGKAPLQPEYPLQIHPGLGHFGRRPALVGLEQDSCLGRDPGGTLPCPDHMLKLVRLLQRQPNRKFLPDHTLTQQHVPSTDYRYQSTTRGTLKTSLTRYSVGENAQF